MALMIGTVLVVSAPAEALQCVPFAREISGISIRGDAWTWWSAAAGQYDRGHAPKVGAVVVFKKFAAMRYGHVAVVARVVNSREVLVDHANWAPHRGRGRGQVSKMVAVTDVSPQNDWTEVRVWNASTRDFGTRTYPTYGFIYPDSPRAFVQQAVAGGAQVEAVSAMARHRMSSSGDEALATADRQIAAALAGDCGPVASTGVTEAAKSPDVKAPEATPVETRSADIRPAEPKPAEAKPAEVKASGQPPAIDAKVPASGAKTIEASGPAEAKVTVVAVNEVKPLPASIPSASPVAGPNGDGVWEGDNAAAKQVGAGHY